MLFFTFQIDRAEQSGNGNDKSCGGESTGHSFLHNFLEVSLTKKERPIMIRINREYITYDKDDQPTRSNTPHIDTQVS